MKGVGFILVFLRVLSTRSHCLCSNLIYDILTLYYCMYSHTTYLHTKVYIFRYVFNSEVKILPESRNLYFSEIGLISELRHHITDAVLNIAEKPTEMNLQRIVLSMWLLQVVVSKETNLPKSHNAILQLVTALDALILVESLLLHGNQLSLAINNN